MADIVNYIGNDRIEVGGAGLHNARIYRYTIIPDPAVAKGASSNELVLPAPSYAEIMGINCQCRSDKYNISLRCRKGVTSPSLNEVLKIDDINEVYSVEFVVGGGSPKCINREMPPIGEIYLVITNNDSTGLTIDILHLELIIGDM